MGKKPDGTSVIIVPTGRSKLGSTTLDMVRKFAFQMDGTKIFSGNIIKIYGKKDYIDYIVGSPIFTRNYYDLTRTITVP